MGESNPALRQLSGGVELVLNSCEPIPVRGFLSAEMEVVLLTIFEWPDVNGTKFFAKWG